MPLQSSASYSTSDRVRLLFDENKRVLTAIAALVVVALLMGVAAALGWFDGELYPVRVNGRVGFIDSEGKTVIPARFDQAKSSATDSLLFSWARSGATSIERKIRHPTAV